MRTELGVARPSDATASSMKSTITPSKESIALVTPTMHEAPVSFRGLVGSGRMLKT
ncbi:hypothetical protein COCC4DRAFT_34319, partial [Bipolaris maydis ATCC 48331]